MIKKWGIRLGLAGALMAGGVVGTSLFVGDQVARGQGAQFDARTLASIGAIINETGLATWPPFSSDPDTCNSTNAGAYFFHTGTNQFRTCNGTAWSDGGGGPAELNDLTDVIITSPTNNQALIHNGSEFVNAAQSAAAINDHTDAFVSAPADGDILLYDGVTDNRWENTPAAAPTTLAGLSDVTITSAAQLNGFYRNASVWVNTVPKARWWLFPHDNFHMGTSTYGASATSGANAVIQGDNAVRVVSVHIDQPIEVDRVIFQAAVQSTNCNDFYGVGLYTVDGNTLLVDAGGQTVAADAIANVNITNVFLDVGDYWLAFTSDDVTCAWGSIIATVDTVQHELEGFLNTGNVILGNATNPSSPVESGNMPATLGAITAITSTADWRAPMIKFVGTDP